MRAVARGAPAVRVRPLRRHRRARLRAGRSRDLAGRLRSDQRGAGLHGGHRRRRAQAARRAGRRDGRPGRELRRRLVGISPVHASGDVSRHGRAAGAAVGQPRGRSRLAPQAEPRAHRAPATRSARGRRSEQAPIAPAWRSAEFRRARCVPEARHPAPLLRPARLDGLRCPAVVADVRVRGARLCCSHRLDGKDHHDRRPRAC